MLGIDTNVLVRFLVRDDESQFVKARGVITRRTAAEDLFVSLVVLAEPSGCSEPDTTCKSLRS